MKATKHLKINTLLVFYAGEQMHNLIQEEGQRKLQQNACILKNFVNAFKKRKIQGS